MPLLEQDQYLSAGVHIGTRVKSGGMREYIYRTREDGLHVIDLKRLDERVSEAAKILCNYEASKVFVVGGKSNAQRPIEKFCEATGFRPLNGRFTPGRFTNPQREDFVEPAMVLVTDPGVDRQAVQEAAQLNVPVIALCDTNNSVRNVDVVIPSNNKGRRALALVYWLLAREYLKESGRISSNEEFEDQPEEYEA
jgi:small subunit ribosomal protein S2